MTRAAPLHKDYSHAAVNSLKIIARHKAARRGLRSDPLHQLNGVLVQILYECNSE